eukprot:6174285-Pleurochrysis_carterae.AAC.1
MAAATGVRAEAPAAAGVDGQSTEKRARKNTGGSGRTTMSSIEATLRVALAEIRDAEREDHKVRVHGGLPGVIVCNERKLAVDRIDMLELPSTLSL